MQSYDKCEGQTNKKGNSKRTGNGNAGVPLPVGWLGEGSKGSKDSKGLKGFRGFKGLKGFKGLRGLSGP